MVTGTENCGENLMIKILARNIIAQIIMMLALISMALNAEHR